MPSYEEVKTFIERSEASSPKQTIMIKRLEGLSSPGSTLEENELKIIFEGMRDLLEKFKSQQSS